MITAGLRMVLLLFAAAGFAGAGAALAVVRQRFLVEGEQDAGMVSVAIILLAFGALCAWVGVGPGAVLGYGGVVLWISYVVGARRLGLFHVATGAPRTTALEETRGGR
ncbi:MAG: hypothetical protein WEB88_16080 [Gemmatimonadota bacterium]